ncbi:hypothetical protein [Halorussus sp. MSC15.2]|uniref:hypothetical protein n=1 Tax=Halorussus sp. MSC15.2 TaxID=2283638 RepID=UPI0013D13060|nr:hypothetical protein [Halorussus sp. MSC15.2]NEU58880.1 hypothetical protein [Halorussus sp. MSC15.2]
MKRRSVLGLAVTAGVVGSTGCTRFIPRSQQYRLWFVRIHNGTASEQRVDIRVLRDGEVVFERDYENIPSFQDSQNEEASFAAMDSARLVEDEWDIQKGTYTIEYRTAGQESFVSVDVGGIDEFEAEDIGVKMQLYGGKRATVAFGVLEFDSNGQAAQFVSTVTNQSED